MIGAEGVSSLNILVLQSLHVTGKPLLLDFFLEDADMDVTAELRKLRVGPESESSGANSQVSEIFKDMENAFSASLVAKVGGTFKFKLTGNYERALVAAGFYDRFLKIVVCTTAQR